MVPVELMILAVPIFVGAFLVMLMMSKRGREAYVYCPLCKHSVATGGQLSRGMVRHYKAVHADYWHWNRRNGLVIALVTILLFAVLFAALGLNLVPPTGDSPLTRAFILGWIAAFIGFAALYAVYGVKTGKRFRASMGVLHPTPSRSYGNLQGMRVVMKFSQGRRGRLLSLLSILEPIGAGLVALHRLVLWKLEKFVLDRYENGTLWYYSLGDMLASLEVKSSTLTLLHEKRLKVEHAGGTVEIETETVSEMEHLRSVLSGQARTDHSPGRLSLP